VISALGEIFAMRLSPDQVCDMSDEPETESNYPRLLTAVLAHAASMVGVRPPKLPQKVISFAICSCPVVLYFIVLYIFILIVFFYFTVIR